MRLDVNGKMIDVKAEKDAPLLFVLRDELRITGTKFGCGIGFCGSCTVLADGEPAQSCVLPISAAAGKKIVTIEGLSSDGKLDAIQDAFIKMNAGHCGFCIPGIIMSLKGLLDKKKNPSEEEIRSYLNGNLCRCGAHLRVIKAVKLVADMAKGKK